MAGEANVLEFLLVAEALVPGSAVSLEALVRGSRSLSEHLLNLSIENNEELSELLTAFAVRIECETYNQHSPTEEWTLRFQSLCTRISAYVDACERRYRLTAVLNAWNDARVVAGFQEEVASLCVAMDASFG